MPTNTAIDHRQPHQIRLKAEQCGCLFLFGDAALTRHKGIIFLGPPGTGKTTAMQSLPVPWQPISQDLAVILPGAAGVPHLTGWDILKKPIDDFSQASLQTLDPPPLHAIFSLNRSELPACKLLNHFERVDVLMKAVKGVWPESTRDLQLQEAQKHHLLRFETISWVAKSVPCFQLGLGDIGACRQLLEDVILKSG